VGFTVVSGTFHLLCGHFGEVPTVRPIANSLKSCCSRSGQKLGTGNKLSTYSKLYFPCKLLVNLSLFPQMYFAFNVFTKQLLPKKFSVGSVFQNDYFICLLFLLLMHE